MANNKENICSICGKKYEGFGNNAQPINKGRCCNDCNRDFVIPMRVLTGPIWRAKEENNGAVVELKSNNGHCFNYHITKGILTDCGKVYIRKVKEEDVNKAVEMLGTVYDFYLYRFGEFEDLQNDYDAFMKNPFQWSL